MRRRKSIKKLHKNTGASLSFALLFFLVALMVSVTILSAAVTAVRRISDQKERQQAILTLESEAKLLKEGLEGTTGNVLITRVYDTSTGTEVLTSTSLSVEATTGELSGLIKNAMQSVAGGTNYEADNLKMTIDGDTDIVNTMSLNTSNSVNVNFTMQKPEDYSESAADDFKIVMTLSLEGKNNDVYSTVLTAKTSRENLNTTTSTDGNTKTYYDRYTCEWNDFSITSLS